jgi:hypothetical protein
VPNCFRLFKQPVRLALSLDLAFSLPNFSNYAILHPMRGKWKASYGSGRNWKSSPASLAPTLAIRPIGVTFLSAKALATEDAPVHGQSTRSSTLPHSTPFKPIQVIFWSFPSPSCLPFSLFSIPYSPFHVTIPSTSVSVCVHLWLDSEPSMRPPFNLSP